ncbi:DinB family protein [Mucilaginibacter sp.]|uniref:DinB family protein n=1 Tax=Mucilaginibacter sp. TaxID=1882438 RepID=UPI002842C31A|nr:DinB family protein [Mucilaginibacter sp.]MDR3694895.1 DinB family protein [Mucilaginibacter sp.]
MSAKKVLLDQYDLHNVLYNNVLADITEEESDKCIADPMNCVKWLAGHLAWAQLNLGNIGGVPIDFAWRDRFHTKEGATPQDLNAPPSEVPTLQQIKDKWNEMGPVIRKGLENLPDAALDTVINIPHPIFPFDNTLAGLWAFINHHQAYTIGQIGILRRGLGKNAMKYS